MISKICMCYTYYIYAYKNFSTTLDKGLRKTATTTKKEEMEKLESKLNEVEALNVKYKEWNKLDKRSSHNPVVFKHGCSLETYLELWRKREIPGHLYFSKTPR